MVLADDGVLARLVEGVARCFERHKSRRCPRAVLGGDGVEDAAVVYPPDSGAGLDADAVRIERVLVGVHASAAGGVVADVACDLDAEVVGDRAVEESTGSSARAACRAATATASAAGDVGVRPGFKCSIQLERHDAVSSGHGDVL